MKKFIVRRISAFVGVCAAALLLASGAHAQEIYATLSGNVTDPTGAVIQGAKVVVHNNETNTTLRTLRTDSSGNYTATNLPAGDYTVTITKTGFRTYTASDVILHVAEKRAINAQLQTGALTQTVTVQETATPVQTQTAAQATTITGTQVRELQLNNRNFEQLVTLQPGVSSGLPDVINFGITNTSSVSINGARTGANNWTVDGADINDSGSNLTLLNVPSIDAIQEFTLERSTYDAQYGRSGGGQIVVATKSGTSTYHGDAYEFVRNNALNANDFFANSKGLPRAIERYNDFGFTLGGPLFIPKVYPRHESKTFFFWSEEWRKSHQPGVDVATVPSAAELNGTFPAGALNPASAPAGCITTAGGSDQINPACFSKNAKAYIQNVYSKFPADANGQYISNVSSLNNYRQDIVRLDQNISDRIHAFARYMEDVVPTTEPGGLFANSPLPGISSTATNAPGRNLVANVTATISPTVVNEIAFNYSWGAINSNPTGVLNSPAFVGALAGGLPYTDPYGRVPGVSITGLSGVAIPSAPYHERNIDKNVYDNFSKVWGNHTIRLGATASWMVKTENIPVGPGSFSFQKAYGNPAFANFLLGNASTFSQSSRDIIPYLNYLNFEAYVQDDWKVTPRLTLNLGVRYSYFPAPNDSHNVLNNFDPLLYNPADAPLIDPATGNFVAGQSVLPATYVNGIIFPAGSACAAAQKIAPVTCSPWGGSVNPNSNLNFGPRFGFAWDPTGEGKTSIRGGYGIFYDRTLNGIWEQNAFADPPLQQSTTITNTSFDSPLSGTAKIPLGPAGLHMTGTPTFKVPSYQDWNFSIEHEILRNTTLQVAYVGTKGTHLLGEYAENQPTLATRVANPTAEVNAIEPYLGYGNITNIAPRFDSNYNSLQVSLNRRMARGFSIGVAYTYSKNLTDNPSDRSNASYDTYNFAQDYGPAALNTPQIFIANYVWDLPWFKDQKGFLGHVLGGWELSGITTFESGQSVTFSQGNDPFNSDDFSGAPGTYPGGIGIDPSAVSPRPDVVPGVSLAGPGTRFEYFNTAAVTDAIGHFGSAGRGLILNPGQENWDLSAIKNIRIGERVRLQLRGEFFNAFNHVNFTSLNTNVDSSSFGRLTGDHLPRQIQLGAKLYF